MIGAFIVGLFIGAWLGFIFLALCYASRGDDDDATY